MQVRTLSLAAILIQAVTSTSFYQGLPYRCFDANSNEVTGSACDYTNFTITGLQLGDQTDPSTIQLNIWYPDYPVCMTTFFEAASAFIQEKKTQGVSIAITSSRVGWGNVVSQPMTPSSHPDILMLGTTQLAARTSVGDILNLNDFIADYASTTGNDLTADFVRFFFYDGNQNGNWYALPFLSDYRAFYFNRTVFDSLGLKYPPPLGDWPQPYGDYWTWEQAAHYAYVIHQAGYGVGFDLYPGWDEDCKLILTIAQNYAAGLVKQHRITDPNFPSNIISVYSNALNGQTFYDGLKASIIRMLKENSTKLYINEQDPGFQAWLSKPISEDPFDPVDYIGVQGIGMGPPFRNKVPTMRYDSPSGYDNFALYDSRKNKSADVGVAVPPGGSVLTITTHSQVPQLAWELILKLTNTSDVYIHKIGKGASTLPPYLSAQSNPLWADQEYDIYKMILAMATSPQYPLQTFPEWGAIENMKPFRHFLMEMIYKNVSYDLALQRLEERVDEFFALTLTVPTELTYSNGGAVVAAILAAIGILASFGCIVILLMNKGKDIIRRISPLFSILIQVGIIVGFANVFVKIGSLTNARCITDIWLSFNALGLILGNLVVKNYRIYKIFSSRVAFNQGSLSDANMLIISMSVQCVQIALLVIWTVLDPPILQVLHPSETVAYNVCRVQSNTGVIIGSVLGAFNGLLVLGAIYLAYVNRSLVRGFNESPKIAQISYLTIALFLIGGFVIGSGSTDAVTQILMQLYLSILLLFSVMIIMLSGEFYTLWTGGDGKEDRSTHTSSSNSASHASHASAQSTQNGIEKKNPSKAEANSNGKFKVAMKKKNHDFKGWFEGEVYQSGKSVYFTSRDDKTTSFLLCGPDTVSVEVENIKNGSDDLLQVTTNTGTKTHVFVIDTLRNKATTELSALFSSYLK